ncbi:MAG TPA: CHAT domain-containing protein [Jatrophihabitans sp.]|nr:CHAT domain-containing protein [Jatrophihabitans sp.]
MEPALNHAAALRVRAVDEHNNGRPARALRLLDEAQRTVATATEVAGVDAQRLEAALWISRAMPEAEVRGIERGLACLDEARTRAEQFGDAGLLVRIHSQTAVVLMRGGQWDRALDELTEAERLLDNADENDQFAILLNAGSLRLFRGELVGTRAALNRALRHARRANRPEWIFKAAHNLGYAEFLAGNLPAALSLMAEADAADVDVSRGVGLLDRARVLVESGLVREADDSLARAARLFAAERVGQDLAETELERARCALASGEVAAARTFAARARDRFRRRGNEPWRRSAELVLLQADLAAGRHGPRLLDSAGRLREELRRADLRLPGRLAGLLLSEARVAAGDPDAAATALASLGPPRRDDPITGRMHFHYVHALVDAARGESPAASRRIRRALDELARYQASFGSIDLRTASALHGRRLTELDISLALQSGRAASIFAAAERARAVSSRLPLVRPPDDPVAAELLAELRQTLDSLRAVEQDSAASEPLLRNRRELERKIVSRSWTVSGSGSVLKPASLDMVHAAVAERDLTMVTFVQAGDALSAVVLGDRLRVVDLGAAPPVLEQVRRARADLDVFVHPRLPSGIRVAVSASLKRSLRELDAALLAPLNLDGPLVLVSTGVLGQLPWASLPSLRGRSLVVAPSATKWLASATGASSGPIAVSALAGPELARGGAEAAAVGDAWSAAQVVADATTDALLSAVQSATILHVAAHGVHQPENPLFSSLRMADGPVFAHELDQKAHAPEHVVLSACEVGLATIRPGDEALGLASVLLHLGTRSVIAGVARVGDEVAEQTMAAYHAKLASGLDSAAALADALATVDADIAAPFVNFGAAWVASAGRFGGDVRAHVS